MDIYDRLSRYEGEPGVVLAYGSMYGNTEQMAERIARETIRTTRSCAAGRSERRSGRAGAPRAGRCLRFRSQIPQVMDIYDRLSRYEGEPGVVLAYGSMYGNTDGTQRAAIRSSRRAAGGEMPPV